MNPQYALCLFAILVASPLRADEIEGDPIRYSTAPANNPISRLEAELKGNASLLAEKDSRSFLKTLLERLKVPESSQTLVFSRTSLQRNKIRPDRPRAIYFNDDVYVGACQNSNLFEFSAVDPNLGVVFYSAEFQPGKPPVFTRQNDSCMTCHGSSANRGYPGHLVRSVYVDDDGEPILSLGSVRVDLKTPIAKRWGGWYVTGTSGKQSHLGNRIFTGPKDRDRVDPSALNRESLDGFFDSRRYLHGHSDIIALMVLEHQADTQNLLTRAGFQVRMSLESDRLLNAETGQPNAGMSDTTWRRIQSLGDQIVAAMMFAEEAAIVEPIAGSTSFTKDFAAGAKRDRRGRSLRDFDLKARMFKYPCSYLIDSAQFEGLPAELKDYVLRRLYFVLIGRDTRAIFGDRSEADRQAVLGILRETKPNLPTYWGEESPSPR
jgi:hypothetical protein